MFKGIRNDRYFFSKKHIDNNNLKDKSLDYMQDYIIDIYGPLDERFYQEEDFKLNRVNYCGILSADEVIPTLLKYDVLQYHNIINVS